MRSATLLALLPLAMAAPSTVKRDSPAPVVVPRGVQLIESKYIVKYSKNTKAATVNSHIESISAKADYKYKSFQGFAATLTKAELETLQNDASVDYIEQDAVVTIKATQEDAPWGLARISNTEPGSTTYTYDDSAGEGTCAYIIDTGIDVDHPEFEGRATWLENFTEDGDTDGQGHGTHVAGTIGSVTYGVSKKTSLYAVKVLGDDGSGTNSGVIAGMDFVSSGGNGESCPNGSVANMSLGGGTSQAVNDAAAAIVDAGIFLAVAAGNEASDASTSSPASEPSACTVGATDIDDALASFSNYGSLVDVLAPGVDILSTFPGGSTETLSGTSMASPHVAGLAAYLLGTGASVDGLCDTIASSAIEGAISGVPSDTANLLINNGS